MNDQADDLIARREAIADLGAALRILVGQAAATEASTEDLRQVTARVREAGAALARQQATHHQPLPIDDLLDRARLYNPVSGSGNPLAPPLNVELRDGAAIGTCTLGLIFEGPPTYAHGGVSALLLDHLLGYVTSASGHAGMTVKLITRYLAPVPLQTPLHLKAEIAETNGRKVTAQGFIATAADPGTPLVEATGLFITLGVEQAHRMFGAAMHPDPADPTPARE